MKYLFSSVATLVATTAVATAQISGLANNIVFGVMELGMIAPNPSICGVVGAFALVAIISARRLNDKS
jgi:hypothetical protein